MREITGPRIFNEVFLDEAVVEDANLIGGANKGWAVTQTTLTFERTGIGAGGTMAGFPPPGPKGGFLDLRANGQRLPLPDATNKVLALVTELLDLARSCGRAGDPIIRQKLARLVGFARTGEWTAKRALPEMARGRGAGLANVGKLAQSRISSSRRDRVRSARAGGRAVASEDGPCRVGAPEALVFSVASSIYGGTDQIQRNIIGERALGLRVSPTPVGACPSERFWTVRRVGAG